MAKSEAPSRISFEYEGTEYVMEFDRESVIQTEKAFGISVADVRNGSVSSFQGLFHGAFLKHHPNIKPYTVEKFMELMPNKVDMFQELALMYLTCLDSLFSEPEEGKAISWTAK